jgi:hypothetical protein
MGREGNRLAEGILMALLVGAMGARRRQGR